MSARPFFAMLGPWFHNRQARPHLPYPMIIAGMLASLTFASSLTGCYWLKYEKLMRTHIELMLAMTDKMSRLLADQDSITPTMMNEFLYPLERARDFARIVAQRYEDRPSLAAFHKLLDMYEGVVTETDRLRINAGNHAEFQSRVEALRSQAHQVETILASE